MFETLELAQALLDTGVLHGQCDVKDLLPSGVTVYCYTKKNYDSLREEFLPTVKKSISDGLAFGASTDMWTNDYRLATPALCCTTLTKTGNSTVK